MKKSLLGILIIILLGKASYGQETKFGLKTGFNLSILSGTVNRDPKFKPGAHIGGFIDALVSENVHLQPEFYYSSQGATTSYRLSPSVKTGETKVNLHYFNLPLIFKVYMGKAFNFQFGPQAGILIGAREKGKINGLEVDENVTGSFKTFDFALAGGMGLDATETIQIGARVNYGVSNIGKDSSLLGSNTPTLNNRVVHFFAGISF